jgi:glycosyltransferase involved in cell wall biosynthesis
VVSDAFLDLRKGIPTIFLDDRLPWFLRFSFKFPVFNFFSFFHITYPLLLPFVVKRNEFDYFIVHGTYTAFSAITLKKIKGIKFSVFIWDPIGYILLRVYSKNLSFFLSLFIKIARFLDKIIINSSDEILVGGDAHNKYIQELNKKAIIKIISPSVHPLSKLILSKEDYVLMVTAWKKGKNPEYIFELVKKFPEIKIKMVGKWLDNIYRTEFEKEIMIKKLTKNIFIVGEVNEKELSEYYSKALVLLQTNDDRGFGMPALEAAGHGTTFIIPQGQGVCNLFEENKEGFFVNEMDTKKIINLLEKLIKDKNLAEVMGKKAWVKTFKNYSWENHALSLTSILKTNTLS